ncbi:MAG: hypothetical protein MPN21_11230 [Thermoanaerobaculia bacterium]|nr:hypothetical protein [Thermoanaerobaculia bacterium]
MRQWIGLIVVLAGAYYAWTQWGADLRPKIEPATPEAAWYLDEIEHHFSIVPERGGAWFFRGFHENTTSTQITSVTVQILIRDGKEWDPLKRIQLGPLKPEERKTFDQPIQVPKGVSDPKLRWEVVSVRRR